MEYVVLQNDIRKNMEHFGGNLKKTPRQRISKAYLETRLESVENYWSKFQSQHSKIVSSSVEITIPYFKDNVFQTVEELYFDLKTFIKEKLEEILVSSASTSAAQTQVHHTSGEIKTKLPPIIIPKFSGTYHDWATFRDLFVSVIDKNEELSSIQKFHYLKTSLVGEAEQLLRNLPLTAANYGEAWKIIQKRYENKKCIVHAILNKFLHQKRLTSESAKGIRDILDTSTECILALKNIGIDTKNWDVIIVHIIVSKLDSETHKQWELSCAGVDTELPTFSELCEFLESRFRTMEIINNNQQTNRSFRETMSKNIAVKSFASKIEVKCTYCSEQHFLCHCKEFSKLSIEEKRNFVQHNNICFNCLIKGHSVKNCRQKTACKLCNRRHHSLLHYTTSQTENIVNRPQVTSNNAHPDSCLPANTTIASLKTQITTAEVLLATVLVKVQLPTGGTAILRALLDQGSQGSFLSETACQLYGFQKIPVNGTVTGIDSESILTTKSYVELQFMSLIDETVTINTKAFVLKKINSILPSQQINIQNWFGLSKDKLADPYFHKPGPIDLILGAEVYSQILMEGILRNTTNSLIAQNTSLGWIISGQVTDTRRSLNVILNHTKLEIDELYKQLWEINGDTQKRTPTTEDLQCEKFYENTVMRAPDGRYIVRLPFKSQDFPKIEDSRPLALKRLYQMEKRFQHKPDLQLNYIAFMDEYLNYNHMEEVDSENMNSTTAYYLPHHAVIRESSLSTKLRVVFDGSAVTPHGKSLNDILHTGPALQQDIRDLVTRWRRYPTVLIADIKQMYRQIRVSHEDIDYQRILWRNSPSDDVKEFKLLTVTYGTACAPYLALKTMQQLAKDEADNYPDVVQILQSDFFMDDLMTGFFSEEQTINAQNRLTSLLRQGGFELHKWASNSQSILDNIPLSSQEKNKHIIPMDNTFKMLGIGWNPSSDKFEMKIELPVLPNTITKRIVLSDVAKIFDPLGWLAPVVITAKIFLQKLWQAGVDWDSPLPSELLEEWLLYRNELLKMGTIYLDRWLQISNINTKLEIHGFSDASNGAYSAVVYLKVIDNIGIRISLVASRTKVAPIKKVTTPRLELCGAVLLSKLISQIQQNLGINDDHVYAWTDSMIVLAWLRKGPTPWKIFVANRVSEILEVLSSSRWRYVSTTENPADLPSRGIPPSVLQNCEMWWNGPAFLKQNLDYQDTDIPNTDKECKVLSHASFVNDDFTNQFFNRFSSLLKLIRVTAYCIRFFRICKSKTTKEAQNLQQFQSYLCTTELTNAMNLCICLSQSVHFSREIKGLQSQINIKNDSKILTLNPFLDPNNILRVGGRLENADLNYCVKHPVILSKYCRLSYLIVLDAHHKLLHGGPQLMLNYIRRSYWIVSVKSLIKKVYRACVICFRQSARPLNQLMGNLPIQRVKPAKPFYNCGVDYAGPVNLKLYKGRCKKFSKAYIVIFVCTSTKAIHLELVSDLTTDAFIATFRRFVARRGQCRELWSDCGTTFVGAAKELQALLHSAQLNCEKTIAAELATHGTNWHFIPPGTPHFGGLWEAGVKSVKTHLKRVLGNSNFTFEEYYTVLTQIEACLNSRPLTPLTATPDGSTPLTPGHFLIGEPVVVVPDDDMQTSNITYLNRWKLLQKQLQDFWKRWSNEYLVSLQQRYKWHTRQSEIEVGRVVLLKDENLPPAKWLLGKVVQKHPGRDGHTRVVSVKVNDKVYKRPIVKICPLPV